MWNLTMRMQMADLQMNSPGQSRSMVYLYLAHCKLCADLSGIALHASNGGWCDRAAMDR
jgi:hypothetical protein